MTYKEALNILYRGIAINKIKYSIMNPTYWDFYCENKEGVTEKYRILASGLINKY